MNIIFLSAANNIHTVRWVNALSALGHEITLISLPNHRQSCDKISENVTVKYLRFGGRSGYYLNSLELSKISKLVNPDVINVHYASGYGTLARLSGIKNVILSVWGSDVYDYPYKSCFNMWIIRRNILSAALIASTSYCMARQTQKLVNVKLDITVTPFGVDTKHFTPINRISPKTDKFTIGVIKALAPKYGIDIILRAFSIMLKQLPGDVKDSIELVICGTGTEYKALQNLSLELNIEKYVTWKGYIPNHELPQLINQFDVFCLGSRLESFGVAAVEAMSCGLPVIATDVDGFKEVIEDNVSGFIVPRDNAEMMASKILQLYYSPELRTKLGNSARKRVEEFYDWNKNVIQMENLYLRLLDMQKE